MARYNLIFFFILTFFLEINAKDQETHNKNKIIFTEDKENLEINADQFTHDKENERIFATGNVEIIDESFKIYAEKVFINTKNDIISAKKKIKIFYKDGSILQTDSIVAKTNLESGKFSKSYLHFPDNSENKFLETQKKRFMKLTANSMERRNKEWEKFNGAVFTACDICYDKKKKKFMDPLIQLKANEVVHDKKKLTMEYYNSFIELSGKPIFYLPYFSHASPQVKRKSGFLAPRYRSDQTLGESFEVPYYYVLNDYEDITLSPKLNTNKNPVFYLEHRKNFFDGEIVSELSGTTTTLKNKDKIRGHINSSGKFDLNKNWFWNYNLRRTTDRNYLQAYKYKYENTLESNIKLQGYKNYNNYTIESHAFQELRPDFDQKKTPKIFPKITSNIKSKKEINKLNYNTEFEFKNLMRDEGANVNKFFILQDFEKPYLLKDGSLIKLGGHINAAMYKIENYDDPILGAHKSSYLRYRFYPQATIGYQKPFYKINKVSKQIFEPKMLIVTGANNGNDLHIPNEDSRSYDLDFIDLFQRNRLSGNDRLDNGTRIDYGFSYTNQNLKSLSITSINIGQSYRLKKEVYQPTNSGSSNYFSNIVSSINIKPTKNLSLDSHWSLDSKDLNFDQIITGASLGNSYNRIYANHLYAKRTEGIESLAIGKRNQMSLGFENRISKFWVLNGTSNFDLVDKLKFLNWNTKLKYEDECFGLSFSWNRQYTYNSENPTSNQFLFLFSLKKIMENDI